MRVVGWWHQAEGMGSFEAMMNARLKLLAEREEDSEHESDDDEREDRERKETPTRPLDFRAAHRRDELFALQLRLRRLPVRGRGQGREEDEGACYPEEGEHCRVEQSASAHNEEMGEELLTEAKLEEVHRERGLVRDLRVRGREDGVLVRWEERVRHRRVVHGRGQAHLVVAAVARPAEAGVARAPRGRWARDAEEVVDRVCGFVDGSAGCARGIGKGGGGLCELCFEVDVVRGGRRAVEQTEESGARGGGRRNGRRHCGGDRGRGVGVK